MIIRINKTEIDTDKDLTASERHILQKLFLWESLVDNLEEFRKKRDEAFQSGWNNSGPVKPSNNLILIIKELESRIVKRISKR